MESSTTYKDSPLGKIPSDWEVMELGDVGKIRMCKRVFNHETSEEGDIPFFKIGTFGKEPDAFISKELYDNYRKRFSFPKKGDILISAAGTLGRTVVYDGSPAYFQDSNIVWIDNNESTVINKYLYYVYQIVRYESEGGTIQRLYNSIISSAKFLCPSLTEQRAIAHILGLMDTSINYNNSLIAKKDLQKKWLMQNLLTGKKKLKGYSGAWKEVQFKDCFQFVKSYSISREGLSRTEGNLYCIHYGDIHALYETEFLDFNTQKSIPRLLDEKMKVQVNDYLNEGDIIIADASEDYKGVGEAVVVTNLNNKVAVGGLHTIVLRDFGGETVANFRGYLFASERVRNELRMKATGTSVYSVTKTTLESLVLNLPSLEEQTAIANVLQTADKEIQLLKAKTDKLKEQKKGLMQVLLTGKKRLKVT